MSLDVTQIHCFDCLSVTIFELVVKTCFALNYSHWNTFKHEPCCMWRQIQPQALTCMTLVYLKINTRLTGLFSLFGLINSWVDDSFLIFNVSHFFEQNFNWEDCLIKLGSDPKHNQLLKHSPGIVRKMHSVLFSPTNCIICSDMYWFYSYSYTLMEKNSRNGTVKAVKLLYKSPNCL